MLKWTIMDEIVEMDERDLDRILRCLIAQKEAREAGGSDSSNLIYQEIPADQKSIRHLPKEGPKCQPKSNQPPAEADAGKRCGIVPATATHAIGSSQSVQGQSDDE